MIPWIAFSVGVVAVQLAPLPLNPYGLLGLAAGLAVAWGELARRMGRGRHPRRHRWLLAGLLCALGASGSAWHIATLLAQQLPPDLEGVPLKVTGRVAGIPQISTPPARTPANTETPRDAPPVFTTRFDFIPDADTSPALPPRLALADYTPRPWPAGSRWQLEVSLKRAHGTRNPHTFDAEGWLIGQGRLATGTVRRVEARLPDSATPAAALDRLRADLVQRIDHAVNGTRYGAVIRALVTGEQSGIRKEDWQVFSRTGLTHLVSVSGVHLTLWAGLVAWLTLRLARWRRWQGVSHRVLALSAGWVAAAGYAALSGWSVPTQRTFYMLTVAVLALAARRQTRAGQAWWMALAAVLATDPFAALALGFWLSFGSVGLMLWVGGQRLSPVRVAAVRSPTAVVSTVSPARADRWVISLRQFLLAQWAATLAMLVPLITVFGELSWVSPLANAYAIPLIGSGITPLALLAAALPFDAPLFAVAWLLDAVMRPVAWLADFPVWQQAAPSPLGVGLALLGVGLLTLPAGLRSRWLGGVLCVPLLWPPSLAPIEGQAVVTVLDVGQGSAVVVRTAHHALLYDTGPAFGGQDAAQRVVLPYLAGEGIGQLDGVMVSHSDSDHAGGTVSVQQRHPHAWFFSGEPDRWPEGLPPANRCQAGQFWWWDGVRFDVLYPTDPRAHNNHASCVLRVWAAGQVVLLTGDIETPDEAALVAEYGTGLAADALLAPHHGSRTSSSAAFLQAVAPQAVLISAGYRNRYHHPHPAVWARYAEHGIDRWRTDQHGALTVALTPAGLKISSHRATHPHWWD